MAIVLLMGCTKDDLNGKVEPVEDMGDMGAAMQNAKETFSPGQSVNINDLRRASAAQIISLNDGDIFDLNADIIVKEINE